MNCNKEGCSIETGTKEHIKGICCNVKNCIHHDCETHCTARQISVGPSNAVSSSDTACATFKERT